MKHLFVPRDIAEELKNVGFNDPCLAIYHNNKLEIGQECMIRVFECRDLLDLRNSDLSNHEDTCSAPLYQQVIDWFFREHDLYILIEPVNNPGQGMWGYDIIRTSGGIIDMWNKDKSVYDYYVNFHNAIKSAIQIIKR